MGKTHNSLLIVAFDEDHDNRTLKIILRRSFWRARWPIR